MSYENKWLILSTSIAVTIAITASVSAESANFGTLTLSGQSVSGVVTGITGGSYSLSSVAKRDSQDRPCLGFATSTPDHLLVLQQDFSQVSLQVNSRGKDTTLLIRGPHSSQLFCGDDTGSQKDASVLGTQWKAGTYRIWVGSLEEGTKIDYTLSVQAK